MTDNKLTDEQIIKAFEICYGIDEVLGCTSCPLYDEEDFCQRGDMSLEEKVFDVYNRQKAEKEALINAQETLQKHIAEIKAEVELYKRLYEDLKDEHCDLISRIKTTKSETRKEFADRLKEKAKYFYCKKDNGFYEECSLIETDIVDNLLKEMESEQ